VGESVKERGGERERLKEVMERKIIINKVYSVNSPSIFKRLGKSIIIVKFDYY
jgi:hypothetical protein